jgi:hypothetical protein
VKTKLTLLLAMAALALPAQRASAADIQTCKPSGKSPAGLRSMGRDVKAHVLKGLKARLGDQYAAFWLQPKDGGWYVGVAPGTQSLASVRAWLGGQVTAEQRKHMHVIRQPYGAKLLNETGSDLWQDLLPSGVNFEGGNACVDGAYRSLFVVFKDATAGDLAVVQNAAKKYGDLVRVRKVNRKQSTTVTTG